MEIIIDRKVCELIRGNNPIDYLYEKGGILLGNIYKDYIVITDMSFPNKNDEYGPSYFIRSKKIAQKIINKFWKKSSGTTVYIGEWHTHNEKIPVPSRTDIELMQDIYKHSKIEYNELLMLIIGIEKTWLGIYKNNFGFVKMCWIDFSEVPYNYSAEYNKHV